MRFGDQWRGVEGIFGGYAIGRALAAACATVPQQPLSLQVQFTGPVVPGDVELRCTVRHLGRRTATVDVEIRQQHPRMQATIKFGLNTTSFIVDPFMSLKAQPHPEDVPPVPPIYGALNYDRFLDTRLVRGHGVDALTGTAAWIRFQGREADTAELGRAGLAAVMLDALPPGLFGHVPAPVFIPTIDFSMHLAPERDWPTDGWMYAQQRTVWATEEFCLEEANLHTGNGALVASARQTRRVQWS